MLCIFANRDERTCLDIVITMISHQRLDCLPGQRLELDLIKNDKRLSFHQTDTINELQSEKDVIQVGYVIEKITNFSGTLSKVDKNIGFIFLACELLYDSGFANTACPLYQ